MVIVTNLGSTTKSIKLVDLTVVSESTDLATKVSGQWYVAEYKEKLVIPVPSFVN